MDRVDKLIEFLVKHSILVGSRGSARSRGLVEPDNADYDYGIFTDDPLRVVEIMKIMRAITRISAFVLKERYEGCATLSGQGMDISVYHVVKRKELLLYDELRHRGVGKKIASEVLNEMERARRPIKEGVE